MWCEKTVGLLLLCLATACSGNEITVTWELSYFGSVKTCDEIDIEEIEIFVTRQSPVKESKLVFLCPELSATFEVDEGSYLFDLQAIDIDDLFGVINRDAEGTTLVGPVDVAGDVDLGVVEIEIIELPPF